MFFDVGTVIKNVKSFTWAIIPNEARWSKEHTVYLIAMMKLSTLISISNFKYFKSHVYRIRDAFNPLAEDAPSSPME